MYARTHPSELWKLNEMPQRADRDEGSLGCIQPSAMSTGIHARESHLQLLDKGASEVSVTSVASRNGV